MPRLGLVAKMLPWSYAGARWWSLGYLMVLEAPAATTLSRLQVRMPELERLQLPSAKTLVHVVHSYEHFLCGLVLSCAGAGSYCGRIKLTCCVSMLCSLREKTVARGRCLAGATPADLWTRENKGITLQQEA